MKEIPKELYLLHAVIEDYIIWLASPLPRYLFYRSFFFYNQKSVLPFLFTSRRKWRRWNVKRSAKITGDVHVGLSSSDVYSIVALFELESWGLLFFYLEEIKYWTCMYSQKTWSLSYYVPLASSFVRSAVLCLRTEPLCPPALGLSRKLRSSSRVELVAGNKERSASSSEMWWWKCANKHTQRTHAGARSCTGKKKKKNPQRTQKCGIHHSMINDRIHGDGSHKHLLLLAINAQWPWQVKKGEKKKGVVFRREAESEMTKCFRTVPHISQNIKFAIGRGNKRWGCDAQMPPQSQGLNAHLLFF